MITTLLLAATLMGGHGAYDELMPIPRSIAYRAARVSMGALEKVTVKTGMVEGAPANVAEEAYVLDIAPEGVSQPLSWHVLHARRIQGDCRLRVGAWHRDDA